MVVARWEWWMVRNVKKKKKAKDKKDAHGQPRRRAPVACALPRPPAQPTNLPWSNQTPNHATAGPQHHHLPALRTSLCPALTTPNVPSPPCLCSVIKPADEGIKFIRRLVPPRCAPRPPRPIHYARPTPPSCPRRHRDVTHSPLLLSPLWHSGNALHSKRDLHDTARCSPSNQHQLSISHPSLLLSCFDFRARP